MNDGSLLFDVFQQKQLMKTFQEYDLLSNIDDFVSVSDGGTPGKFLVRQV